MSPQSAKSNSAANTVPTPRACPLNDSVAVVDQILAALTAKDARLAYDVALDLRSLLGKHGDAEAVLADFQELRALIEKRHYLACYRLRRALESQIVAQVTLDRREPPCSVAVRLDVPSVAQLRERCLEAAAAGAHLPPHARVQFVFGGIT